LSYKNDIMMISLHPGNPRLFLGTAVALRNHSLTLKCSVK
jgi:hypothetical protein